MISQSLSLLAAQVVLDLGDDAKKQRECRSRKLAFDYAHAMRDGDMTTADSLAAQMRRNEHERACR